MSKSYHHIPGFRTILLSNNLSVLGIVIVLVILLFARLYSIIDDMQGRIQQYILLDQLSTEIKNSRDMFIRSFDEIRSLSETGIEEDDINKLSNLLMQSSVFRNKALLTIHMLDSDYTKSPDKYFLNRGIVNGLIYINNLCNELDDEHFILTTDSYIKYYQVLKVFEYIQNYASNMYLSAAVTSDVSVLRSNIVLTGRLRILSFISITILILASIICVLLITTSLSRNIKGILSEAERITSGSLNSNDLKLYGPRELVELRGKINIMKRALHDRIELEGKIHKQELEHERMTRELETAQFQSLQAQINPHFLFNAINIISHTALFEKAVKTVKLINSLAALFRYSLEFKNETTLDEELNFIRRYLEIQKARFGIRLSYQIECPEELKKISLPPFSLEPIVENSVVHGIEPVENGGFVHIKINRKSERNVTIQIEDNGSGIPEHFLPEDVESETDKNHIGIKNVIRRIKIFYPTAITKFERASKDGGTIVSIILPTNASGE